ncbi:MAG: hypothetical protein IJV89_07655 [Lentisphaeria bacterium]|nr:hypothetical protein [Lentisphaeria bacterium]
MAPELKISLIGAGQMAEWHLRGEAEPLSTPEEALTLMKLVDAAYCSAETGQPVKIV